MLQQRSYNLFRAALLLGLLPLVIAHAHGDEETQNMEMGGMNMNGMGNSSSPKLEPGPMSYFRYPEHSGWIYGHILVMTLGWTIVLPLGVMFSVAKSRYTLPVQVLFFILNGIGVFLSIVYDAQTPDLYENNAHHKIGWIFTWILSAWILMGLVNLYARRSNGRRHSGQQISVANMTRYHRLQAEQEPENVRWSGDSGQGTERNSYSLFGSGSPGADSETRPFDETLPAYQNIVGDEEPEKRGFLRNSRVDRFLSRNIHRIAFGKTLKINRILYTIIERLIIIMGWIALMTGIVTFGGLFRGGAIFNGLAHWIKGGIFFWYGILTLGRWMGAFADFGWAWNAKPGSDLVSRWKSKIPSAEFTESFVIFLYGASNVFLEHLAAWGEAWSATDFEHVSITILFFGGGLLGMLIESHKIRDLLSTNIIMTREESSQESIEAAEEKWTPPENYTVPLNPMPALVILLLGLMMSSHTQESMTSSMIHKQWGTLFVGYALSRGVTYLLLYIKPPTSYLPARPPTEIISSFCLAAGGLVFMASSRDVVYAMEWNGLDAMFGFTVTMGLTALIMAWEVVLIAVKGWAVRKERPNLFKKRAGAA